MLNLEELVVLCRCVICSLQAMCGKKSYPSIIEVEKKVDNFLGRFGMASAKSISLHEFQSLVLKDFEILQLMKSYHFLNSDDLREVMETETDIVECDSDVDLEIETKYKPRTNRLKSGPKSGGALGSLSQKQEVKLTAYRELFSDEKLKPMRYRLVKEKNEYPDFSAEPMHIYGYRGYDMRNNIKFSPTAEIVSFTSNIAWILDRKTNSQRIFQGHSHQISCIASFDNHFATGEISASPLIYIWEYKTMQSVLSLCSILKQGVAFLCFSNDGKRLAAMDTSENHTVVIYDYGQLLTGKTFDFNEHVLGIFKGPKKVLKINCRKY
jgi:WD40 repeat protein